MRLGMLNPLSETVETSTETLRLHVFGRVGLRRIARATPRSTKFKLIVFGTHQFVQSESGELRLFCIVKRHISAE
jgi:hypothetical protein